VGRDHADPEKGTGLVMVCTFGDLTNVVWWRELQLPTRPIVGRDGRILADPPPGLDDPAGREAYAQLAGATVRTARQRVVEMLRSAGDLDGEPVEVVHAVKFYERGDKPLEIVTTRQWYIRNGGRDHDLREALLERGRQLAWHPEFMRARYESWVTGLTGDWLISRQRFHGVPIPVWYPLDKHAEPVHDKPILPDESMLPVDPGIDTPPGYEAAQRGMPNGFIGDLDVMDTWATSSLTPQIAGGWGRDDDLFHRVFPMDLRPQAHEIIRTWLFATVVRSHLEHHTLPWRHVAISGWVLDPDRKKMSKSKGKAVTPLGLLDQYGSDAVRYWAASGRLGTDTAFDTGQMKVGRRLAVKILNVNRFVLGLGAATPGATVTHALDRSMLAELAAVVDEATAALDGYEYTRALERAEQFFWRFCDDYIELAKARGYGERGQAAADSARTAMAEALSVMLRLFAPFLPYVTEEVWSWWREGSIHRAEWPTADTVRELAAGVDGTPLAVASQVIAAIRKAKSEAKLSVRAEVAAALVRADAGLAEVLRSVADDVCAAGRVASLDIEIGDGPEVVTRVRL
jgi:valyl-tRNA synthetase